MGKPAAVGQDIAGQLLPECGHIGPFTMCKAGVAFRHNAPPLVVGGPCGGVEGNGAAGLLTFSRPLRHAQEVLPMFAPRG